MSVSLTPAEARTVLRIASHEGGRVVVVDRPDSRELLEVTRSGGEMLWVGIDGAAFRLCDDPVELAGREAAGLPVFRRNLIPVEREETDAVLADSGDDLLAAATQNALAIELANLADTQIDGLGDLAGREGRDRMRVLLAELDRRGA